MKEKLERFRNIYYNSYKVVEKDNYFFFVTDYGINTPPFKFINFLKEDAVFKQINELFAVKVKPNREEVIYSFYFVYEDKKFLLTYDKNERKVNKIEILKNDIWNEINIELEKYTNSGKGIINILLSISEKLTYNLINNSTERIILLLSKE